MYPHQVCLAPSEIRFSQDSIAAQFTDKTLLLKDTFRALLHGTITVNDIPRLIVLEDNGEWYALQGNRRLYLYKKLQSLGQLDTITVKVTDSYRDRQYFEDNRERGSYTTIRVRGRHVNLEADLNHITRQWKLAKNSGIHSQRQRKLENVSRPTQLPASQTSQDRSSRPVRPLQTQTAGHNTNLYPGQVQSNPRSVRSSHVPAPGYVRAVSDRPISVISSRHPPQVNNAVNLSQGRPNDPAYMGHTALKLRQDTTAVDLSNYFTQLDSSHEITSVDLTSGVSDVHVRPETRTDSTKVRIEGRNTVKSKKSGRCSCCCVQ